jgi:hypothetical protein
MFAPLDLRESTPRLAASRGIPIWEPRSRAAPLHPNDTKTGNQRQYGPGHAVASTDDGALVRPGFVTTVARGAPDAVGACIGMPYSAFFLFTSLEVLLS